jgi:nucleoside-diphosphate-sugar epimerase
MARVLVLGGVGFVGRNLVRYLVDNKLASKVRVVDKVLPSTAYLDKSIEAAFNNPIVEYKQANLASPAACKKVFEDEGGKFDYVVNCASETKYSQTEDIYKEKVRDLAILAGKEAAAHGVKKFIELSTSQVYDPGSKASKEDGKLKPFTVVAKFKLEAEKGLAAIDGLPLVVLRPATIYGPADTQGLAPRLICAAVYTQLKETMEFLWTGDLKLHTVHVRDVCKAIWLCCEKAQPGSVYNLADHNDTTQKTVNKHIEKMFAIKTGFVGTIKSQAAKSLAMRQVVEDVNEKHLKPWSDLCKANNIVNTPLTPYLDQELLYDNNISVDGSKIEKELGFTYDVPKMEASHLQESIDYFISQNLFPKTACSW